MATKSSANGSDAQDRIMPQPAPPASLQEASGAGPPPAAAPPAALPESAQPAGQVIPVIKVCEVPRGCCSSPVVFGPPPICRIVATTVPCSTSSISQISVHHEPAILGCLRPLELLVNICANSSCFSFGFFICGSDQNV